MQGLQALGKRLGHGLRRPRRRLTKARLYQRLHYGERVLDAMIELADQHALALCGTPPLSHVAENEDSASERAVEAQDRRTAMLDRHLSLVAGHKEGTRFEPGHGALTQRL